MSDVNRSRIEVDLRDVFDQPLRDPRVRIKLLNRQVESLSQAFETTAQGVVLALPNVPAAPVGSATMAFELDRHRAKQIFIDVPSDKAVVVKEVFFVRPKKVRAALPSFEKISIEPQWRELKAVLLESGITSALAWSSLGDEPRAGLLNLHAKMQEKELIPGIPVFRSIRRIVEFHPARIFALCERGLLESAQAAPPEVIRPAPGGLHTFPGEFKRNVENGSFKTPEPVGNLQLTFAESMRERDDDLMMVDADIDNSSGLNHVFDVLKHKLTKSDSHPFDIHQILAFFQKIDPGYRLV